MSFTLSNQENLQTLGAEIERLIKQQRDPEYGARRKWRNRVAGKRKWRTNKYSRTLQPTIFLFFCFFFWRDSKIWSTHTHSPNVWRSRLNVVSASSTSCCFLEDLHWTFCPFGERVRTYLNLFHPHRSTSVSSSGTTNLPLAKVRLPPERLPR